MCMYKGPSSLDSKPSCFEKSIKHGLLKRIYDGEQLDASFQISAREAVGCSSLRFVAK